MRHKKSLFLAGLALVMLVGLMFLVSGCKKRIPVGSRAQTGALDKSAVLYRTVFMGEEEDSGFLFLPYARGEESEDYRFINAAVDLNGDGMIASYTTADGAEQNEWLVHNMITDMEAGSGNRYAVAIPDKSIAGNLPLKVYAFFAKDPTEAGSWQEASAGKTEEMTEIGEFKEENFDKHFSLDPSGELVGGIGGGITALAPKAALAAESPDAEPDTYAAANHNIPDNAQDYNECVPTSIADNFQWLAKKYGFEDRIPGASEMIDELKGDLEWTNNGTGAENVIGGKTSFINRRALPLEAHQIGTEYDPNIQYKIYQELNRGQGVEMIIDFFKLGPDGLSRAGSHMVAVGGTLKIGDFRFIVIIDPGRDQAGGRASRDIYELNSFDIIGYWGGKTTIRTAYAQSPVFLDLTDLAYPDDRGEVVLKPGQPLTPPHGQITQARSKGEFFDVSIDHPGDHMVGDKFLVTAVTTATRKSAAYKYWKDGTEHAYTQSAGNPWGVEGEMEGSANLSPAGVKKNVPALTRLSHNRFTVETQYKCETPGIATIKYTAKLSWPRVGGEPPAELTASLGHQLDTNDTITVESPPFMCYAAPEPEPKVDQPPVTPPAVPADGGGTTVTPEEPAPQGARSVEMAFEHVKPGVYSEVYLAVITDKGTDVTATLTGPGVDDTATKTITADANGLAHFTWKVVSYGTYTATGHVNGVSFRDAIAVK